MGKHKGRDGRTYRNFHDVTVANRAHDAMAKSRNSRDRSRPAAVAIELIYFDVGLRPGESVLLATQGSEQVLFSYDDMIRREGIEYRATAQEEQEFRLSSNGKPSEPLITHIEPGEEVWLFSLVEPSSDEVLKDQVLRYMTTEVSAEFLRAVQSGQITPAFVTRERV